MSTDTKYQVMGELLGIHAAAIEKAEEQAGRIIEMVKGEGRFAPPVISGSIPCNTDTLNKLNKLFPSESEEDFTASVKVQAKPKHHPIQTEESKALTAKVVSLRKEGLSYRDIAKELGITNDAARNRYEKWQKKQKEFCGIPKDEPKNDIEPIPFGNLADGEELYEPGAEEARQEAEDAEATIRKSLTVEEQIGQFIRCMILKDPHVMDLEIMHAVHRNFAGVSISVKDIAAQRRGIA